MVLLNRHRASSALVCLVWIAACDPGQPHTEPQITPIPMAQADEAGPGAEVAHAFPPLAAVSAYLDGFHFYSGEMDAQVEAHHFVTRLDEHRWQTLIFDGAGPDARLIGVEYIISAELFATLPASEKRLWHSHAYEVRSGLLIGPQMPVGREYELMGALVNTYGKTWHTWHTKFDPQIPIGIPALMMAFTADGQVHDVLVNQRDEREGVDTAAIAERRQSIPMPTLDPSADAWQRGEVVVLEAVDLDE